MKRFVLLLLVLAGNCRVLADQVEYELRSFSRSEPTSVLSIAGDWDEPVGSGRKAFTVNFMAITAQMDHWTIGLFQRGEHYYRFTPDTALLKYQTENKIALLPGKEYELALTASGFEANGLSLGYDFATRMGDLGITLSLLEGQKITDGKLQGQANAISEDDYDFSFDVDYFYSRDSLFDRNNRRPGALGFSLDIDYRYTSGKWSFELLARDLVARLYWSDTPRTIATADSDTKRFDGDGYVVFDPVASGVETTQDYTQDIRTKLFLTASWDAGPVDLLMNIDDYGIERLLSAGIRRRTHNARYDLIYNFSAKAAGFDYLGDNLTLSLLLDDLRLSKAKSISISFGYRGHF